MAIGWKTEETKTTVKKWWLQTQWSNIGATPSAGNHPTTREDLLAACAAEGIAPGGPLCLAREPTSQPASSSPGVASLPGFARWQTAAGELRTSTLTC